MDLQQEKNRILQFVSELMTKPYIHSYAKILRGMQELQSDIQGGLYTVVVLGEFKRGKSTLINALLGTRLLPMDVLPETATINAIMYEEKPQLVVVQRDGTLMNGEISPDFLKQYSARAGDSAADNVRYIKIGYPCELLRNHVVLVDTPGVSDLSEQRSEVTYQFIPKANAVLFVLDANAPLKKTEKEFIDEHLLPIGIDNIIFIINKYDAVDEDEEEEFLDNVKKRLRRTFQMDTKDAQLRDIAIYPLSAKQALQGIETGNEKLIKASGLEEVKGKLRSVIFSGQVEQEKLQGYRQRLFQLLSSWEHEIQGENAMKSSSLAELEAVASTLSKLLQEKTVEENSVDSYIKSSKRKIYAMTDKSLQFFHGKLRRDIISSVESYQHADFKNFVEQKIPRRIQKIIDGWIRAYAPHVDELLVMMERELIKGLSRHFKKKIRLQSNGGKKLTNLDPVLDMEATDLTNIKSQIGAITAVGAVAIATLFSPALVPILTMWGRSQIFESILERKLAEAKADVIPQVESQLVKIMQELQSHVHIYIDKRSLLIKKNIQHAYDKILTDIQKRIESQIVAKRREGADVQREIDELTAQAAEIRHYMSKLSEEM